MARLFSRIGGILYTSLYPGKWYKIVFVLFGWPFIALFSILALLKFTSMGCDLIIPGLVTLIKEGLVSDPFVSACAVEKDFFHNVALHWPFCLIFFWWLLFMFGLPLIWGDEAEEWREANGIPKPYIHPGQSF
jgi:hypothetical protein